MVPATPGRALPSPPAAAAQVRWAACQALGQMCTDLGPDIQEQCGQEILPSLMKLMDDFNAPRVQVSGKG